MIATPRVRRNSHNRHHQDSERTEGSRRRRETTTGQSFRDSISSLPFLSDIDIYINGGFEPEEVEIEIDAIDEIFVPTNQVDETILSDEELRLERRRVKLNFTLGCLLAFTSGLTLTVNNFIVKATGTDFGEIMACRGLLQMPVMFGIIAIEGNIKKIFPATWYHQILVIVVGIFGALTMLTTFACVMFMPVGDAMTLIFTNPLFTMIFAAIFLGHRLTLIKNISAFVLMIGIVLVTKPPFLFPPSKPINETTTDLIHDYLDRNYVLYDLKVVNWTDMSIPTHFEYLTESAGDHYFIGAIIALSSAIFSASNNIVIAKLGKDVPLSVQLFYIGCFGFIVALLCEFIDPNDRFFTSQITEIPYTDILTALGIGSIGLFGFFCTTRSLTMIPPSTVATLRTSQIFVAFIAQVLIMQVIPSALDVIGALSIFLSAVAITFEKQIFKALCGRCCIRRQLDEDEENIIHEEEEEIE